MPAIPKIPETPAEYQSIVSYLQSKTIPSNFVGPVDKYNFVRRCKKFEVDKNGVLYLSAVYKNGEAKFRRRRVVPPYDNELRVLLLDHFHDRANHRSYYKTFTALSEKHIGITQQNVQEYINECTTCSINSSIKEKTDMKPVVSMAPWYHIQIDLIDFQEFTKVNYGFAWLLTCAHGHTPHEIMFGWKMHGVYETPSIFQSEVTTEAVAEVTAEAAEAAEAAMAQATAEAEMAETETAEATMAEAAMAEETAESTAEAVAKAIEERILQISKIQQSVNDALGKYCEKMCQYRSVHRKKSPNNTIEPGIFKRLTSNNHTAIVEVNGKDIPLPIKRIK
ncbi:17638_t:CDS:2, partial [Cetraspora pellucida]